VVHRHAESDLPRHVRLPVLEAARVRPDLVAVLRHQGGGVEIEERGLEAFEEGVPDIEETRTARAAEILAPGGREHVAAKLVHVQRHLARRLAAPHNIWPPRHPPPPPHTRTP